jgi:hypothetical protein
MFSELSSDSSGGGSKVPEVLRVTRDLLLKRVLTDDSHTVSSVEFAFKRMRDAGEVCEGEKSAVVMRRMVHLSGQHCALLKGYEHLDVHARWRGDNLQQAYVELLAGLADHPMWVCEDDGRPSFSAACANLVSRWNWRCISARREEGRRIDPEPGSQMEIARDSGESAWAGSASLDDQFLSLWLIDRGLRSQLSERDYVRWRHLCRHVLADVPQNKLADELGTSHVALRAEMSRFRRQHEQLLRRYFEDAA